MTDRFLQTIVPGVDLVGAEVFVLTAKLSDERFEGGWSRISDPIIVFADHNMDGKTMSYHGGPVAGTASGVPVQLIFWGTWWNGPGSASRAEIEAQTHRLLDSRYFAELTQYGIPRAPVWRGSITVLRPEAPASDDSSGIMRGVLDLVDDLLWDNVFPDPDDGPRIAFLIVLPDGFVVTDAAGALGAHSNDYDFDSIFDSDEFWAGWSRFLDPVGAAPDGTMSTIAHELVEIITDPEGDAWHTEVKSMTNEIVDAGSSPAAGQVPFTTNATDQTAYTDGVLVQAYWSNARNRTVIPLKQGYAARLKARIHENSRSLIEESTFTPQEGGLSSCLEDRPFWYRVSSIEEGITVSLDANGFHAPVASAWTINGTSLTTAKGDIWLPVTARGYRGIEGVDLPQSPLVSYRTTDKGISLTVKGATGGFDIVIGCRVVDAAITGNIESQPTANPRVTVGVRGVVLEIDPEYTRQLSQCLRAFLRRYEDRFDPTRRPRPGDPPAFDVELIRSHQPAYVSQEEWIRGGDVARGISAAYAMLESDEARLYAQSLLQSLSSVSDRLSIDDVEQHMMSQSVGEVRERGHRERAPREEGVRLTEVAFSGDASAS